MRIVARVRSVLFAVALAACASPTLPLPPPAAPNISVGSEPDTFHLASDRGALPNALIVVVNRNSDLPREKRATATLADENGSWSVDVFGHVGDFLDVAQQDGTTSSPTTTVQLR